DQFARRGVRGDEVARLGCREEQVASAARGLNRGESDGRSVDTQGRRALGKHDLKQELKVRDVGGTENCFLRVVPAVLRIPVHLQPVVGNGLHRGGGGRS